MILINKVNKKGERAALTVSEFAGVKRLALVQAQLDCAELTSSGEEQYTTSRKSGQIDISDNKAIVALFRALVDTLSDVNPEALADALKAITPVA